MYHAFVDRLGRGVESQGVAKMQEGGIAGEQGLTILALLHLAHPSLHFGKVLSHLHCCNKTQVASISLTKHRLRVSSQQEKLAKVSDPFAAKPSVKSDEVLSLVALI